MNKIKFPLRLRMKGGKVNDLQVALQLLVDRGVLLAGDVRARRELPGALHDDYAQQLYGEATHKLVCRLQEEQNLKVSGEVKGRTAATINRLLDELAATDQIGFSVRGTVRFADDSPAVGFAVAAFDRDLRDEQLLGRSQTDKGGRYQIQYATKQFGKREKDTADLVIKVLAADGAVLATSAILFNAPSTAEIDVTISGDALQPPSLFERITRELAPLLDGVRVPELEEDKEHQDLTFLTGETGIEQSALANFILAHRLTEQGIQAEFWFGFLRGSSYEYDANRSLAAQSLAILNALSSYDLGAVGKALAGSFNQSDIPQSLQRRTKAWIEAFRKLAAQRSTTQDAGAGLVKSALDDARISGPAKREKFARLFQEHQGLTPELLTALKKDKSFKKAEIADLETSFQLADLTQADFSVVKVIKETFDIRTPDQIRTLAKKSETEWTKLVAAKQSRLDLPIPPAELPGKIKIPQAQLAGKMLERQFREAFPTTAFSGGLERALRNGGARGLAHAKKLSDFLDNHAEFELLNTPVDEFLMNHSDPKVRSLGEDKDFRLEVKAVQRVFKLAPTFEATDTLLADGLHSAQKIYSTGKSEFVRRYREQAGFTQETANTAWDRAANTHAAVLTFIGELKSLQREALPRVLYAGDPAQDPVTKFPNWDNLFQAGDICECEHCRSVLGPAAYFADLLTFLKYRAANGGQSVKDVLLQRRPDLGFLELNCDNALIVLPYIDVVCEVLERAVDRQGDNDLQMTGFKAIPGNNQAAKVAIANALKDAQDPLVDPSNQGKESIDPGANFSLSQVDTANPDRWVVHGDEATFLLKKKAPSSDFFAEILPNTKSTVEELRAYPQYVNPKAYEKLKTVRSPLALPFDLFAEEVRAGFQKCNLQRWDLMRTFRGAASPNNPSDGDIAAEYFGISSDPAAAIDEKRLILVPATVAEQKAIWGESGNDWLDKVANVRNFLQKAALEYTDLLELLDLKAVNPNGDIAVHHQDNSCDTDKKDITGLTAAKLDTIHRFLRLWRKLKGWKMWELDLAIRRLGDANNPLDEPFLINLFYFSELRRRLGGKASVEQVLALFGALNIESHFTKLHEKRADAHYQDVFLNKRLIKPLDPAFDVAQVNVTTPTTEKLSTHQPTVMAALGVREADLTLFKGLIKASDGTLYISAGDDLNLTNLSFLWRHAWLSKLLKFKAEDWKTVLKIVPEKVPNFANLATARNFLRDNYYIASATLTQAEVDELLAQISYQEMAWFACPKCALEFLDRIDQIKATGFAIDELNWLLAADHMAKAAPKEPDNDSTRFLAALRKDLQDIGKTYDPTQYDFLGAAPPSDEEKLVELTTSLLQTLNRSEADVRIFLAALAGAPLIAPVQGLPANFVFPAAITIAIRYDEPGSVLRFTGLMTSAEESILLNDISLAAVSGIPSYQQAIADLFFQSETRRLVAKFFEPIFSAPLGILPAAVDFKLQLNADVAAKIEYDTERQVLRFTGFMSNQEKAALDALAPMEFAYVAAINSLATQPQTIVTPDARVWLTDNDLDSSLAANDTFAKRLANAATKALGYLSGTLTNKAVIQQSSTQLGLTEALTDFLLNDYALPPATLLTQLTGAFVSTSGSVDYANPNLTIAQILDSWFWASRVAAILKKWKITFGELKQIIAIEANARLLAFQDLFLQPGAMPSLERFLRTHRLVRLRDSLPETKASFLAVLTKLNANIPATVADLSASDFPLDVEKVSETWPEADVKELLQSLDIVDPADYLLAKNWERLRRVFYYLNSLNGAAATVKAFAGAVMSDVEAKSLKELLRSKFGEETWLTLSAEIQDVLRERKRDALAAYLLSQLKPADAPTDKWENTNDLYAYYLLDVEMSSCQLTSRLVQGSGSVQLFVQRCFMGLEPNVTIVSDGDDADTAWRWWKWMSRYRVWEANRKVFLWPENWIEPELKKDRSSFFKDMENELQQNEINQYNVETAFLNYLEKLDGVAQLEIAGFYQQDDGDDTIIHLFGRTSGAEPHSYYYRRYDYRQWTPWEKVDLDIQGDYLIPAVLHNRLFLFWPVFTEVPDEAANATSDVPSAGKSGFAHKPTTKRLRLQMAVSDFRQGKWSPKKVSTGFDESETYTKEIQRRNYHFYAIDRSDINGTFGIQYSGFSEETQAERIAVLQGGFQLTGCKGVPELGSVPGVFRHGLRPERDSVGRHPTFSKWLELDPSRREDSDEDFSLRIYPDPHDSNVKEVLAQTPGLFKMSPPWHLSYMDRLVVDGSLAANFMLGGERGAPPDSPVGSWLPFFYNDKNRTFFVLPLFARIQERKGGRKPKATVVKSYYPDVKKFLWNQEELIDGQLQKHLGAFDVAGLTAAKRGELELFLFQSFPEEASPPYTGGQIRELMRRWFMRYVHRTLGALGISAFRGARFHFKNFYHPFVCDFIKLVDNPLKGIPALMRRETQLKNTGFSFDQVYRPTTAVIKLPSNYRSFVDCYPAEVVDFSPDGAYSPYNWELFFHAPLLIANSLSRNQRFEEAREWYHFIFNPIGLESGVPGGSAMSKYWITKPFFETTDNDYQQQRIDNMLLMLAGDTSIPGYSDQVKTDLQAQVLDWRRNPFEPHRIANYRTVAYQKTAVMKYLDNLIAWGDNLFRQESMESINEATELYVLAAEILGPRPKAMPPRVKPPLDTYNELENKFDDFSNALVQVENLVPQISVVASVPAGSAPLPMLYFCIPHNEKMLGYWDTIADRLYKIRHCMNIEGVVRQLTLFAPPIDPAALVKAVAAGLDIGSALADLNAPLPLYRFNTILQKANEVCSDVKALGGALLAALEKKDAEALGLLRQSQELKLLEAVKLVREQQINEAKENLQSVTKSRAVVETRRNYYRDIERLSTQETLHLDKLGKSHTLQEAAQGVKLAASIISILPAINLGASGFGGSPLAALKIGGLELGQAASLASDVLSFLSQIAANDAAMASSKAGFDRRWDDWKLQEKLADKELEQFASQIAATELRIAIAEKELENQALQIENSQATDAFMRSKYTNQELYQWQLGQISGVYFQSYKLAYDLAKRAERCFRFELGLQESSYISFGYWDSLKKGLLSGEKLQYDLRRLETAYLEQNRRELELTKHVSLALLDPVALIQLRETGRGFFRLPEELFDLDYPGHYFRRIKSVALTLPCVAGPYTSVSCTLRLIKNSIRITPNGGDTAANYPRNTEDGAPADDDRFIENNIPVKNIAMSSAQNDNGVFELSFRDERYLPFEGAGGLSEWSLELFSDLPSNNPDPAKPDFGKPLRQFDYDSISDAILHVKYTAREDAGPFKNGAIAHLREYFEGSAAFSMRILDLRREFPTQWHRFLNPADPANGNVFEFEMSPVLFPFRDFGKTLSLTTIALFARGDETTDYTVIMSPPLPPPPLPPAADPNEFTVTPVTKFGGLHFQQKNVVVQIDAQAPPMTWRLKMSRADGSNISDPITKVAEINDLILVVGYQWVP